ncbi:cupin domain-containing protein [Sphingobium sp. Sx8-8]|uniref:cupin domain-containing protein n=1 Tax=Sphingobium sp. Sx8-8 TaxID=2933617 RepID=UPI001F581C84|nr:cupin domain-containing protein [Sphingobium sp. Sx8-8]
MATINIPASLVSPTVYHGTQDIPADQWEAFSWHEPKVGDCTHGEAAILRPEGTSGSLMAGLWRTYPTAPGAGEGGSQRFLYTSPSGDEVECVIEGHATLTVIATGEKHRVSPGSIISSPKGLEVLWEVEGPYFKKFWCVFDGTHAKDNPPADLLVTHINADHSDWREFKLVGPDEQERSYGQILVLRDRGSTGNLMCGLWRGGVGIPGSEAFPVGNMAMPYNAPLGDETMLLIDGAVDIVSDTGDRHSFQPGDIVGLSAGQPISYTSRGLFNKKFWIATGDG